MQTQTLKYIKGNIVYISKSKSREKTANLSIYLWLTNVFLSNIHCDDTQDILKINKWIATSFFICVILLNKYTYNFEFELTQKGSWQWFEWFEICL